MVRKQVEGRLRSLCVSVLESDLDSRRQLESAVGGIADRLSKTDARSLEQESRSLGKQRHDLLVKLAELGKQLLDARGDEYRDIVVGGKAWSPSDSARKIAQERTENAWIPGPVQTGATLPLSENEVSELYATNATISPDAEKELSGHLPEISRLPKPADFEKIVTERVRLDSVDREFRNDLWKSATNSGCGDLLREICTRLDIAVEPLSGRERWKLAAVYAGKSGGAHREPWDSLVSFVE